MATMNEIENFLVSDFQATREDDGVFSKMVNFDEKHSQYVMIALMGGSWLQIIVPLEKLPNDKLNNSLEIIGGVYPVGGLIKLGSNFAYRQSVSIKHFSPDLFNMSLAHTVKCSMGLKEKLGIT
jgi:hypothetical protein